jgi:hypothetical protein
VDLPAGPGAGGGAPGARPPAAGGAGLLRADHLLVGHGKGVHGSHTPAAIEHALETARAGAPKAIVRLGALLVSQATRRATRSRAR